LRPDRETSSEKLTVSTRLRCRVSRWLMTIAENQTEIDPRSTSELIKLALRAGDDDDAYWKPLPILHRRASKEVLDAAFELCASPRSLERKLGVDILGQLGVPTKTFPKECADMVLSMFANEQDPEVLASLGHAAGRLGDARAIDSVVRLKDHLNGDVRWSAACSLSTWNDDRSIAALIELTSDSDVGVRDWATFGLGSQMDADRPEIREALLSRTTDEDFDTRGEALVGLAKRRDARVVEALLEELASDNVGSLAVEAAKEIADPRLRSVLEELRSWWDVDPELLQEAIEASTCQNQ
jgi:HEAT repeat protein